MKAITTSCILTSLRSRTDGSLGLSFSTPELTAEEKTVWFQLQQKNCRMLLEPTEDSEGPPVEVKGELQQKTAGQRLRGVLFVFWTQQGKPGEFQTFYESKLESIITQIKNKLDP